MNIYDISKKTGVSIATVSRVINNNAKVSEKTRRKVLDAIEESGYTPNAFARGLGLNTMKTIAYYIPVTNGGDFYGKADNGRDKSKFDRKGKALPRVRS